MRRPGFLGDLDGFWFSGLGLVHSEGQEIEPWLRHGRVNEQPFRGGGPGAPDRSSWQREAQLTRQSRAQGWLTTGPVKQHYQLPVATPQSSENGTSWTPFDFDA